MRCDRGTSSIGSAGQGNTEVLAVNSSGEVGVIEAHLQIGNAEVLAADSSGEG